MNFGEICIIHCSVHVVAASRIRFDSSRLFQNDVQSHAHTRVLTIFSLIHTHTLSLDLTHRERRAGLYEISDDALRESDESKRQRVCSGEGGRVSNQGWKSSALRRLE